MVIYNYISLFYETMKVSLWSIRTFWYKGLAKTKMKNDEFGKCLSVKNNSPGSKADFPKKTSFGIWMLISSEYDIK